MTTKLVRHIFVSVPVLSCALIGGSQVEAQFAFTTNSGSITITGYNGPGGNVIIPATTNGYPVTTIGAGAFSGQTTVTNVTIPNSVTNVGVSVFDECAALTNVTIGCSVIGESMFRYCFGLTSVTIPNTVTSIGDHAFLGCHGLTNVIISSSVTNIGPDAFSECYVLQQAYFQGNAPSVDGTPGSEDNSVFYPNNPLVPAGTVYYVPGTTGWSTIYGGWPVAAWYQPWPQILGAGAHSNGFQFTISWATNGSVVVEACTSLAQPVWTALATNVLVNGTNYFDDSQYASFPNRFYRARAQ